MTTGPRPTFADRWREYGDRPPIARVVSRASMLAGAFIAVALIVATAVGLAVLTVVGVRWLAG